MKKFLVQVILFFFVVICVDVCLGYTFEYMKANSHSGKFKKLNHAYAVDADILILGSSRALHHIIPEILVDSLGMSCYNCGWNASSIVPMYSIYSAIIKKSKPKIVIYDVYSACDIFDDKIVDKVLNMKPYYSHSVVHKIYDDVLPNEKLKMTSMLYRYNSEMEAVLSGYLKTATIKDSTIWGYEPFYKELNYEPESYVIQHLVNKEDPTKLAYLRKLIESTRQNKILLCFCVSPWYKCSTDEDYSSLKKLCKEYNVPLLNHLTDSVFNDKKLFADPAHLNDKGARIYTRTIAHELQPILN